MPLGRDMYARVRGRRACYTRPEYRTERYSNLVPSVSGWDGQFSQILNKKGVRYHILWVGLLFHPRWMTMTANEVKDFGNGSRPIDTEKVRTLRTTTLLTGQGRSGVDFVAAFRIGAPDNEQLLKFVGMFDRRIKNGHFNGRPYLGMADFPGDIESVERLGGINYPVDVPLIDHGNGLRTVDYSAKLGICFYGTDWHDPKHPNYFAPLDVDRGIVRYPSWDEVRRMGIRRDAAC